MARSYRRNDRSSSWWEDDDNEADRLLTEEESNSTVEEEVDIGQARRDGYKWHQSSPYTRYSNRHRRREHRAEAVEDRRDPTRGVRHTAQQCGVRKTRPNSSKFPQLRSALKRKATGHLHKERSKRVSFKSNEVQVQYFNKEEPPTAVGKKDQSLESCSNNRNYILS